MANLNRLQVVIRNTVFAVGLPLLGSVIMISGLQPCSENARAELSSPDRKYVLRVGDYGCGANRRDQVFVSLERATFLPKWLVGGESRVLLEGPINILPQWLENHSVVLKCWYCNEAVLAELGHLQLGNLKAKPEKWRFDR